MPALDTLKPNPKDIARTILVTRRAQVLAEAYREQFEDLVDYQLKLEIAKKMSSDGMMSLDVSRLEEGLKREFSLPGALAALAGESSELFYSDNNEFFTLWQFSRSEYLVSFRGDALRRGEDLIDRIRDQKRPTERIVDELVDSIKEHGAKQVANDDDIVYGAIRGQFSSAENFVAYLLVCQNNLLEFTQLRFEAESSPDATKLYLTAKECFECLSNSNLWRFGFPEGEMIYGVKMRPVVESVAQAILIES